MTILARFPTPSASPKLSLEIQSQIDAAITKAEAKLDKAAAQVRLTKARKRKLEQLARHKRLLAVGTLAEQAGILLLDDEALLQGFKEMAAYWQDA